MYKNREKNTLFGGLYRQLLFVTVVGYSFLALLFFNPLSSQLEGPSFLDQALRERKDIFVDSIEIGAIICLHFTYDSTQLK